MQPFVGSICTFGFNYAPYGWQTCAGQIVSIAQNTTLFSLLGVNYGGDGITTFCLPDLRSRVMVNQGQGPGLSSYVIGEETGLEQTTALVAHLPAHGHALTATTNAATTTVPLAGQQLANAVGEDTNLGAVTVKIYSPPPPHAMLNITCVGVAGGSQPLPILQPLLTLNTSIALYGIYPSRN